MDDKNARNIDVNLWTMTNQETGEYGVSHALVWFVFHVFVIFGRVWWVDDRTDILMLTIGLKFLCNLQPQCQNVWDAV